MLARIVLVLIQIFIYADPIKGQFFSWFRTQSKLVERSIQHDGLTRWYLEYQPDSFQTSPVKKLVIVLHGGTQGMHTIFRYAYRTSTFLWLTYADQYGFLVLAPNAVNARNNDTKGENQNWNDLRDAFNTGIDDVGFIADLINWAITERSIDPNHVYITGASNGGVMTYRLLIEQPNLFAAGVAFIANLPEAQVPIPANVTPIMIVLGTKDKLMKWDGGTVGNDRGTIRSALATRDYWIYANNLNASAIEMTQLDNYNRFDNCIITSARYETTNASSSSNISKPFLFYTMQGGGHVYPEKSRRIFASIILTRYFGPPCRDASGTDLAWTFMSQYPI